MSQYSDRHRDKDVPSLLLTTCKLITLEVMTV